MDTAIHNYDPLLNRFFSALKLRQHPETNNVLTEMQAAAATVPRYAAWATYLSGVLAQEIERDWARAESIFLTLQAAKPPPIIHAHLCLSLGIAYEYQGRWDEAIAVSAQGATLWDELQQPLHKALLLRQIAVAYFRGFEAGDVEAHLLSAARTHCAEALALLESPAVVANDDGLYEFDRAYNTAITYQVLGNIDNCIGNFEQAYASFRRFLDISISRNDAFSTGFASWHLADTYQLNQYADWQEIATLYDNAVHAFAQTKELYYQANLLACKGSLYRRIEQYQNAIDCYQQSMTLMETVRAGISSEEARGGFFSTVVNIHDNAILTEIKLGTLHKAFESAELARSRVVLDKLTVPLPSHVEKQLAVIAMSTVQTMLADDEILLEFHCTGLLKRYGGQSTEKQATNNVLYPEPKILVIALGRAFATVFDLKISPNTLLVSDFDQPIEQLFSSVAMRRALYNKLLKPLEVLLQDKRRLYIVPHGPLHYVPFHALIAADGDTLLRAGGPEIIFAPSATILFRQLQPNAAPPKTCLAIGYNGEAPARLRFAEAEARHIASMTSGALLLGKIEKKAQLYQQAPDYQALHFSCHGEFEPDTPLNSVLHIGPNETLTGQEIIDNLRLRCKLVTLSACESGLSRVKRGDELYGLIRAFLYAGAAAILATLWRVDERSTVIFVEKFYQQIQQGVPYATALKEAQLYLKTLTRPEALDILSRYWDNSEQNNASLAPPGTKGKHGGDDQSMTDPEPRNQPALAALLPEGDSEFVFADPKFWAPFVLIGNPESK